MANEFTGFIDEVAVYPTALSPTRMRQHYRTAIGAPGRYATEVLTDAPVGYWRLNDSSTVAVDSTSHILNGTYSTGITYQQTGLLSGPNSSTLALYFREMALDEDTMLDLDGTKQATLDGLGKQPDATVAKFTNRRQSDLDLFQQSDIDTDTQFDLERLQDYLSAAYYETKLTWDATQATLTILNANGQGYTFDGIPVGVTGGLLANTNHILLVDVLESTIRARIYALDPQGRIQWSPVIFDSTLITDDSIIHRRKGRFGWYTKLLDGDAYLANVRTRKLNFGEYRSHPLYSDTPVRGTVLHAGASPDKELVGGLMSSPWGGVISLDTTKSSSGESFQITNDGTLPLQGVMTNKIYFNNFEDTEVSFKVFFPASALSGSDGLVAFLYGEFANIAQFALPPLTPDRWQEIKIDLATVGKTIQAGKYNVVLVQSSANVPATWYIDKFSVRSRAIRWEGRGRPDDAWHMQTGDWIPFADNINDDNDGIVFAQRGSAMQVRGQARTQDAYIQSVKMVPQYAQLGQFVWKDQAVLPGNAPTPSFTTSVAGHKVTVNGTASMISSTYYSGTVLSDNPISYWRLGESAGATATDSADSNPGTYLGGPTLGISGALTGDGNTAASFDGLTQYVNVPDAGNLRLVNELTLEAWVRVPDFTNNYSIIGKSNADRSDCAYEFLIDTSRKLEYVVREVGGISGVAGTGLIPVNTWTHVLTSFSASAGNRWRTYINGVLDREVSGYITPAVTANLQPLQLGARANGSDPFKGSLDEVAIYNVELSPTQIAHHYAAGVIGGPVKSIIAYYWTWGDGGFDYGPSPSHTYAQTGTYPVTLTVIDNLNQRASLTQNVTVI